MHCPGQRRRPAAGAAAGCAAACGHRAWRWPTRRRWLAAAAAAAGPANGSIFQSASYRPLFEDHRARLVGDTLTVQIVEKVSASQKSTSSIDKGGSLSASVTALPGVQPRRLRARRGRGQLQQHLRRQGRHREQQRLQRHHHRRRAPGAAQRPPADRRREADRRQQQRRRAALLGPGRPALDPARQRRAQRRHRQCAPGAPRPRRSRPRRRPSAGCRASSSACCPSEADARVNDLARAPVALDRRAGLCRRQQRAVVAARRRPASVRIKEVAAVQGVRSNQLVGYGLVVGLDGTGDQTTQTPFTTQSLNAMLQQMGVTMPPGANMQLQERGRGDGDGAAAAVRAAGADRSTSTCRRSATPRACAAAR